jgi:hypothetical protein
MRRGPPSFSFATRSEVPTASRQPPARAPVPIPGGRNAQRGCRSRAGPVGCIDHPSSRCVCTEDRGLRACGCCFCFWLLLCGFGFGCVGVVVVVVVAGGACGLWCAVRSSAECSSSQQPAASSRSSSRTRTPGPQNQPAGGLCNYNGARAPQVGFKQGARKARHRAAPPSWCPLPQWVSAAPSTHRRVATPLQRSWS